MRKATRTVGCAPSRQATCRRDGTQPMRKRRQSASSIEGLRLAIDCMPVATREAMLRGLDHYERILVGAYTDERDGVCPMLAAHRCGGRTNLLSFAKSWDRFARAGGRNPRAATPREVRILVAQLRDSLESVSGLELDRAIAEHHVLVAHSKRREARVQDRARERALAIAQEADPRGEIRARRLRDRLRRTARRAAVAAA
jgi:hypothetical protein